MIRVTWNACTQQPALDQRLIVKSFLLSLLCLIFYLDPVRIGRDSGLRPQRRHRPPLELAISNNLIAGGVVVIGNHAGILSSTARGRPASPNAPLLDEQTIFDLAP